jgi:hypothetical protein
MKIEIDTQPLIDLLFDPLVIRILWYITVLLFFLLIAYNVLAFLCATLFIIITAVEDDTKWFELFSYKTFMEDMEKHQIWWAMVYVYIWITTIALLLLPFILIFGTGIVRIT